MVLKGHFSHTHGEGSCTMTSTLRAYSGTSCELHDCSRTTTTLRVYSGTSCGLHDCSRATKSTLRAYSGTSCELHDYSRPTTSTLRTYSRDVSRELCALNAKFSTKPWRVHVVTDAIRTHLSGKLTFVEIAHTHNQ